jgi:DNA transformation protein
MPSNNRGFADYCCEILSSLGPVVPKRMFGGWGLSTEGLTIGIVTDLGSGDKLWLKASEETRSTFEAAGCVRFAYGMRQGTGAEKVERSMNYYSAPEDAMDSAHAMAPWARLALGSAVQARAAKPKRKVIKKRTAKGAANDPLA